ncbi:sickle tail protein homolog isoform X5 [Poecilia latipinna]|uniref:sickle tail protein homolog isoform X5 n=1 Tax=Poecilia latipinna TaxID=48699 RepID=UPI00072D981D|nr:PREDICTED: sickle tail protein homolog isoform X5 [Poecilia latipinna]
MSKASRLARPPSAGAGSKLPSPRKECPGTAAVAGRARVLNVGEKLMRAGNDGALNRQKPLTGAVAQDKPQSETQTETRDTSQSPCEKDQNVEMVSSKSKISPPKVSSQQQGSVQKQSKSNLKVTSAEDTEHVSRRQASPNGTALTRGDAKGNRTVPRRHTLGGARSSKEILAMQPSDMDKKREAFLEHLKQKYPHHASAIMGHQERLREQSRSPKHGPSPQPGVGDQVDHLSLASLESLDAMSETDAPTAFTRGSRVRASLPVVRSTNQTKDRSLGVLYLQHGDETKQIRMPNEITSIDTIRALFVSAFPQHLNMKMLESPSAVMYVKDDMRNMYYELADVRNITDHSCLKVYHRDAAQAFSHGPRPANGDARMHSEMAHVTRDGQHPLRHPPMGPPSHHPLQGALPPTPHSMPPSPSRIPFGPRQNSVPGSATIPRDRMSNVNPSTRSISPCPSAILERRDVKPDQDLGGKSHTLTRGNEGLYADPYLLQEGRITMTAGHGQHGNPGLDGPEHGMAGFHRASIRSTSSFGGPSPTDSVDHSPLYRQKSRNSQLPTLGSKTPPPSPHRMTEVRMIDIHGMPPHGVPPHGVPPHAVPPHGVPPHAVPPHGVSLERGSPVRQSFRKEEVAGAKPRNTMGSPVIPDPQGHPQGPTPAPNDQETRERMKVMEQQITSLTGLVHHVLLKAPNSSGNKESQSERTPNTSSPAHSAPSSVGSTTLAPKTNSAPPDKNLSPLKVNLMQFRKNVSDLRIQLHQMRQLQVQNQEVLRVQLKRAEQEISIKLTEAMRRAEDPVQRQRALVEEDRHKYLGLEERVLVQLSELEQYVASLQPDSATTTRVVTLKDVEEGAVTLRKVGESLAGLKGEFPALQTRMRAVLRVEVEAVKFLKEEPHKLDSMLKRVKSLTDTLSSLRRYATEGSQKGIDISTNASVGVNHKPAAETAVEAPSTSVQLTSSSAPPEAQSSTVRSEVMPSSPVVIHHVQSSPVHMQQSQQSAALIAQPSPPLTPSPTQIPSPNLSKPQDRESPKGSVSDPPSPARLKKIHGNLVNNGNSAPHQDLVIEELQNTKEKSKNRVMSIEAAEKEWEEKRQNMGHYNGKEFEKILQEAQANMMKGIPSLEVEESQILPSAGIVEHRDIPSPFESPSEETLVDKPSKKGSDKLPKPLLEKSIKPASSKTAIKSAATDNLTRQGSDKSNKSPPPPPPRKTFSSSNSGMTTTRSGEVVYTRKESISAQEVEEDAPPPSPQFKPTKATPETKPKPITPPPVTASVNREEEDEGDKIMAELQVFQKCTVKDLGIKNLVEPTNRIEPQIKELRPGNLLPHKEKKQSSEPSREDKDPDTDENGNTTTRQSPGVIYYVTGQIPKDQPPPSGLEDTPEHREPSQPLSQVSNVNANDNSPSQQQQMLQMQMPPQPKSPPPVTPPPISPKPTGLNGFKLPQKQVKRAESLKTSAEVQKEKKLNKTNTEKKTKQASEHVSSFKNTKPQQILPTTSNPVKEVPKVQRLGKTASKKRDLTLDNFDDGDHGASLSPDLPGEEAPPPPDIAFMITNKKIQPLSCGEYQELVSAKKGSVQTVTVGSASNKANTTVDPTMPQDNGFNKKPVIIIFDEPMDIRSAYKRLSTIFECEEELERMLAEERIDEESEESDTERSTGLQVRAGGAEIADGEKIISTQSTAEHTGSSSSSSSSISELMDSGMNTETNGDAKQDGKKKFKFKFPKKQLAALTQAIRTGTKSGKKTLQVVVYEDEEEFDGTVRQHREAKRFEITRSKSFAEGTKGSVSTTQTDQNSDALCRTNEIRKNAYKTLDSLEQTIKQLETTINEMGPCSPEESVSTEDTKARTGKESDVVGLKRSSSLPTSRAHGPKVSSKSLLQKKTKPQLLPRPVVTPSSTSTSTTVLSVPTSIQQNSSAASPTSRMPVPLSAKSRQSPATTDKTGKQQKLQDAQRQFRQANGSAKRVGGDHKTAPPTIPVSKIPAFYPSSAKGSSQSALNSDATNPINPSSSAPPSATKSSHTPRSGSLPSSHIPSLSNGSLKLPAPSQHTGKALSFSSQTQNGRVLSSSSSSFSSSSSSSSFSPSPLSPTPLGPGGKSIRTIHTPSFTSYRSHNGSSSKSSIPTTTAAKDTT